MEQPRDFVVPDSPAARRRVRRATVRVLVLDHEGRILLFQDSDPGAGDSWWITPGGGIDPGETEHETVLRELAEETGYAGELEGLAGVSDRMFHDVDGSDRMHAIRILYRVRIVGGDLRDEPDGSTDTCRWFTPREARKVRLGELARHALDLPRPGAAPRADTGSRDERVEHPAKPEPAAHSEPN